MAFKSLFLKRADQATFFIFGIEMPEATCFFYIVPFPFAFSFSTLIMIWPRMGIAIIASVGTNYFSTVDVCLSLPSLQWAEAHFEKNLKLLLFGLLLVLICNLL